MVKETTFKFKRGDLIMDDNVCYVVLKRLSSKVRLFPGYSIRSLNGNFRTIFNLPKENVETTCRKVGRLQDVYKGV